MDSAVVPLDASQGERRPTWLLKYRNGGKRVLEKGITGEKIVVA